MIALTDVHRTAREYVRAAKLLRTRNSCDASVYLCGYAVEIALKARICRTLHWTTGFPETNAEFRLKGNLKTHDLEMLLEYTGMQDTVRLAYFGSWSTVKKWSPEQRYDPRGTKTVAETNDMIRATQQIVRILL